MPAHEPLQGASGADDVNAFLAAQPADVRAALERLRRVIAAAAPDAVESINYGCPPSSTVAGHWSPTALGGAIAPSMSRARR